MKRKIAMLLTAVSVLSCAASVSASTGWQDGVLGNGFEVEYNTKTNEIHAKGYMSKTSDTAVSRTTKFISINIPAQIDGTAIKAIGERAFTDYDEIEAVTLPETIETIGKQAFWGADSFSRISLPNAVTTIGESAFESCDSLANVGFGSNLRTIGARSFKNCKAITTLALPDSVESIGANAFEGCRALSTINLGKNISDIGNGAFKDCKALKSVVLPSGLTTLKTNTFDGCSALENVTLPNGLKTIENAVFNECGTLRKVYIPATVKTISKTAFDGAENVTIYCKNGSYAQQYALDKKIPVVTGEEIVTDETVPDHINVIVNGEQIKFKNAQPVIIDSRTLVPMREIFEALGLVVDWDAETKTVTGKKGVTDVRLTIGSSKMYVDGKEQKLDVPAQIIDGSTMVPLRAISNSVGCKITWDQNTRTANITD
ncbi:MAG: leucine-rich repeat protein [Firmicutes bacterium]|nr:leucine-rich repeat protein [Bacillota bacterium]